MTPEEQRREQRRLQELTHRNLRRLLDSELSLADTMADLAETESELGDDPHARLLLEKVQQSLDVVRRHMADNHISDKESQEIETRLQELTQRLDLAKHNVLG